MIPLPMHKMNSRVFLIANCYGWHTYGKSTVGDVENGTLHFDPTAKENNQGEI
jgi:hypothetical protein